MARFYGEIGYGTTVKTGPGVSEVVITPRNLYGDVLRLTKQTTTTENVIDDVTISSQFSLVADAYALEHFFEIKYIKWRGRRWKVTSVELLPPRLLVQIGGIYNGQTPS